MAAILAECIRMIPTALISLVIGFAVSFLFKPKRRALPMVVVAFVLTCVSVFIGGMKMNPDMEISWAVLQFVICSIYYAAVFLVLRKRF